MSRRGWAVLLVAWVAVGFGTGVRLHLSGGVFGEPVPLLDSLVAQLAAGLPWVFAVTVAVWAGRRWPLLREGDLLRAVTIQAWIGMGVVALQQVLLAGLRSTVVAPGLRPFQPWDALVGELVTRGPAALAVYAVIVVAVALSRLDSPGGSQEVPAAGRGVGPSS